MESAVNTFNTQAGAFGNYIDKESAVRIGVLPDIPLDKIISAGNTAGAGVSMTLVSKKEMELLKVEFAH